MDPLAGAVGGGEDEHPVFAVDVSVWPRCDAEASPQRGFYYHPSRHSSGQPIVAGWAYQFIAQLNFARESWTAPVDVERVAPSSDANIVAAAEQIRRLLERSRMEEGVPLFVFDAGYDPVKLQQGLDGYRARMLVRLRSGRCFYADPRLAKAPARTGRPRRHGPKMKCNDPSTWPEPDHEYTCEDAGYGNVRVRAWSEMHPKVAAHEGRGSRGPLPIVVGTLVLVEVARLPRGERRRKPRVLWLWWAGPEEIAPELKLNLGRLRQALRSRAHLPLPQANVWMDELSGAPSRTGRPVDVVGLGRLYAVAPGTWVCGGSAAAVGEALRRSRSSDAGAGATRSFGAFGGGGDAREATETLWEIARTAQGAPLGPGEAPSGHQEGRLRPPKTAPGTFCDGHKAHRKTPRG